MCWMTPRAISVRPYLVHAPTPAEHPQLLNRAQHVILADRRRGAAPPLQHRRHQVQQLAQAPVSWPA